MVHCAATCLTVLQHRNGPLHDAAQNGHTRVAEELLISRADVKAKNSRGYLEYSTLYMVLRVLYHI
jgi:hypothetical protein